MTRCPSALELEAYLLDPVQSRFAPHVDACARCRGEVAAKDGHPGEEGWTFPPQGFIHLATFGECGFKEPDGIGQPSLNDRDHSRPPHRFV